MSPAAAVSSVAAMAEQTLEFKRRRMNWLVSEG
jgi:hypothetical protein